MKIMTDTAVGAMFNNCDAGLGIWCKHPISYFLFSHHCFIFFIESQDITKT